MNVETSVALQDAGQAASTDAFAHHFVTLAAFLAGAVLVLKKVHFTVFGVKFTNVKVS